MNGLKVLGIISIALLLITGCTLTEPKRNPDVSSMDGVIHVVQAGETLSAIAKAYEVSPQLLRRTNVIQDPKHLQPGARIFVPGATERRAVATERVTEARLDGLYHTIAPGETLATIAQAYEITPRELKEANYLPDSGKVMVGQKLWIPRAKEIKDVPISKVTIVTDRPSSKSRQDPRVREKVVPPPEPKKPSKLSKETTPEVEFPREVTTVGAIKFQWPLKGSFRVLRPFKPTGEEMNTGIDLGADMGTTVCAAADGEVQLVGGISDDLGNSFGNYIILYHGEQNRRGIRTIYAHNSENLVKVGQPVKRGEDIARIGNTGRPVIQDGGVLHFEIRELDKALDPTKVLPPLK